MSDKAKSIPKNIPKESLIYSLRDPHSFSLSSGYWKWLSPLPEIILKRYSLHLSFMGSVFLSWISLSLSWALSVRHVATDQLYSFSLSLSLVWNKMTLSFFLSLCFRCSGQRLSLRWISRPRRGIPNLGWCNIHAWFSFSSLERT